MAVIGSIRKRTGLVIGVIAVALLMFLLTEWLTSISRGGSSSGQNVGMINGKKIDYMSFQKSLGDYEESIFALYPQAQIGANDRANFRDEVWNNFTADALLSKHFNKMGLSVSADELGNSIWGDNIHGFAQVVFGNPQTGQYDRNTARDAVSKAGQAAGDDPQKIRIRHLESLIEDERMKSKYTALYSKGIYTPDFMAKDQRASNSRSANISYIHFPYTDVEEGDISYTDKDLKKYIEDNEDRFTQEASREIKFYTINIVPSVQDTVDTREALAKLLEEELKTTDDDSLTVRRFSDIPYNPKYLKQDELVGDPNLEALFEDEIGTYYDPYFYRGAFNVAKLKDRKLIPDSVSARHILLVPASYDQVDSLRALADSMVDLLRAKKGDFDNMALVHSQDQSNSASGGDLGFFTQGTMVPPTFNDACFYDHKEGDVFSVDSRFGIHVIKIDKSKPVTPAVKVAVIAQLLEYSKKSEDDLFSEIITFQTDHNTTEKFNAAEGEYLIEKVSVTQNQVSMAGLTDAREMIKWAFTEKIGTVKYFDLEDKFIVALLSRERKEGAGSLDDLRIEVEQAVKNEKKAAVLAQQISSATAGNIQELASSTGKEVKTLTTVTPSSVSLEGSGNESEVVGHLFGLSDGELSGALEGSNGVYVVQMNTLTDPGAVQGSYAAEKASMRSNVTYQSVLKDLQEEANIDDTRYLFY